MNRHGATGKSTPSKITPTSVGATFGSVTVGISSAYVATGSVLITCVAGGLGLAVVALLMAVFLIAR
ncbi:hypothetical protein CK936_02365 [Streptomyces albireticuli]|uniref:Uncharacterized protein n=1 Tax=Streptomyces albireticuli TaxID=1940 RepID=A0A2A2DG65_9ACTN|nr:hypothetical protein CK936_02365 [Streptomyces albireticuli]